MTDPQRFEPQTDPRPDDRAWPAAVWPPPAGTVLTGATVELRPSTPDDALDLFVALDDVAVWQYLPGEQPYKVHVLRELIEDAVHTRFPWTVRLRASGEVVGWTSFQDTSVVDARTEIGWTQYATGAWGTAVNPETKLLLLTHAFEALHLGRVQFKTDVRNERSQRALDRMGARYEGVLRRYQRRGDGTVRDSVMFSVTAEEWPDVRARLASRLA